MGFSVSWLSLREPADHAARDTALLDAAARAAGPTPVIVDLGSGTGSTIRAFSKTKMPPASWRLLDNDRTLLDHAVTTMQAPVTSHQIDLRDLGNLPLAGATLVTASALLDLCSRNWVVRLADILAASSLPFYAALNYDGIMEWSPANPADDHVTRAFNQHQRSDKGFGSAMGPDAADIATEVFQAAGYKVYRADSPWVLDPSSSDLQRALLGGIADAAAETGMALTQEWLQNRLDLLATGQCRIGHQDILALPKHLDPVVI